MLGDGISRMNCEYFPWKTLAKVASNRVAELKDGDGKVEQKLKAIQNTRYSRISHFLIHTTKHVWIVWRDSAIESTSHETLNEYCKQPVKRFL